MAAKKKERIVPVKLGDNGETIRVRYVGPKRRRELREAHTQENLVGAAFVGDVDDKGFTEALAGEMVAGWSNLKPEWIGGKLIYEDYDELPTDENGFVPFSRATMLELWWNSERLASIVRSQAARIMEAEIAAKNSGGDDSSRESSPATD